MKVETAYRQEVRHVGVCSFCVLVSRWFLLLVHLVHILLHNGPALHICRICSITVAHLFRLSELWDQRTGIHVQALGQGGQHSAEGLGLAGTGEAPLQVPQRPCVTQQAQVKLCSHVESDQDDKGGVHLPNGHTCSQRPEKCVRHAGLRRQKHRLQCSEHC